jgi:hypothetical protein
VPDNPRYVAHTTRARGLASCSTEPAASYWAGYRLGMVRASRGDLTAQRSEEETIDRHVSTALVGEADRGLPDFARWCGYHDGMRWADVTQHRGLLRLAIGVAGVSNRTFASRFGVDESSLRQMLAGTRPVPATRHAELLDLVSVGPAQ